MQWTHVIFRFPRTSYFRLWPSSQFEIFDGFVLRFIGYSSGDRWELKWLRWNGTIEEKLAAYWINATKMLHLQTAPVVKSVSGETPNPFRSLAHPSELILCWHQTTTFGMLDYSRILINTNFQSMYFQWCENGERWKFPCWRHHRSLSVPIRKRSVQSWSEIRSDTTIIPTKLFSFSGDERIWEEAVWCYQGKAW